MSFFVWNKMSARNLLNYSRNHNALDFFFKGKWKGWMKWPLHQPCEPLSLLLLSITLTASHKCHTISKISLTFILAVPKKENDTWCVYQGRSLIPHSIFFLSFFKLPFKLLNDFVNMFIFCNCFSTEVCFVFSPFPLGCGSVTFTGSNLDCLHLTQPAKLISNYGGSLQISPFTQTQTWINRLKACLCFNTMARLTSFFFRSESVVNN